MPYPKKKKTELGPILDRVQKLLGEFIVADRHVHTVLAVWIASTWLPLNRRARHYNEFNKHLDNYDPKQKSNISMT